MPSGMPKREQMTGFSRCPDENILKLHDEASFLQLRVLRGFDFAFASN
jgi:hypothetical protein